MTDVRFIYVTAPSLDVAQVIGRAVLEARLAACVNIIPGMRALYWWEGVIEAGEEVIILVKTTTEKLDAAMAEIKRNHPYKSPVIAALAVERGNPEFLAWIAAEVRQTGTNAG